MASGGLTPSQLTKARKAIDVLSSLADEATTSSSPSPSYGTPIQPPSTSSNTQSSTQEGETLGTLILLYFFKF